MLDKCLALFFSLMILGQAYFFRRIVGTWLFPACLFGLFWFFYTFFALGILLGVPVQPFGIGFIFLATLAFSLGSVLFDWKTAFKINNQKGETAAQVYGSSFVKFMFYFATIASLIFLMLNSFAQGFSLSDLFFNLYASAAAYAGMRYSESLTGNLFGPLGIVFAYLGSMLGGLRISCVRTKAEQRLVIFLSFLPAAMVALTQSARGLLFLCIAYFFGGVLAYRVCVGKLYLFKKNTTKLLALYGTILVLVVAVSFMAEGLYTLGDAGDVANKLIWYFSSYTFGHVYAFSDWFSFAIAGHSQLIYPPIVPTHGFYTFMALFRLMGSHKQMPLGIFDEFYSYRDLLTSNIFTMFRGLITDFGLIGSILFMLIIGFLVHGIFQSMLLNRRPVFSVAFFIFTVAYFYYSFLISLLTWNNVPATLALLWVILRINKAITQKTYRQSRFSTRFASAALQARTQLMSS